MHYDPMVPPDADKWLSLDEQERIDLVMDYHNRKKVDLPNIRLHATFHVIVENQFALGDEIPVQRTLERLIIEGLDRHDAVHAVAETLVLHMHNLYESDGAILDPNEKYYEELNTLTAKDFLDRHNQDIEQVPGLSGALAMSRFPAPVSGLLKLGRIDNTGNIEPERAWRNYVMEFGFTDEHIPDLIDMACDPELNNADEGIPEVWAPVHAWRALGQLKAAEAVMPLLAVASMTDDDLLFGDLPRVLGLIGPQAFPDIEAFLDADDNSPWSIISAIDGIKEIVFRHPDYRDRLIPIIITHLGRHKLNDPMVNASLIWALVDFKANHAISLIREAFESEHVDISVIGDLEDVEISMGIRSERSTPKPNYLGSMGSMFKSGMDSLAGRAPKTGGKPTATVHPLSQGNPHRHVGRNDPCPCGSGKKFKKCCLH